MMLSLAVVLGDCSASPPHSTLIWDSSGHSGWIEARPQGAAVVTPHRAWDLWESNPRSPRANPAVLTARPAGPQRCICYYQLVGMFVRAKRFPPRLCSGAAQGRGFSKNGEIRVNASRCYCQDRGKNYSEWQHHLDSGSEYEKAWQHGYPSPQRLLKGWGDTGQPQQALLRGSRQDFLRRAAASSGLQ